MTPRCEPPARVVLAVMAFLGMTVVYMLRANLSVALVTMVNGTRVEANNSERVCPADSLMNRTRASDAGEFNWDEQTQGLILGSFFWGYILTQIPGGVASEIFGAKWIYGFGVLWTSLLTLLTPAAARAGAGALVCLRVLEGIGEGVTFPSMHAMLGRWIPPLERTIVTVFVFSGSNFGIVIGLPLSGLLCSGDFLGGWPAVFYIFGALGCVWFILWACLVHSWPHSHPRISEEEKRLIESSLAGQDSRGSLPSLPLRDILKSSAVWSLVAFHFSYNWTSYMLLTCLPTYFSRILSMPVGENGFASALPYAAVAVVSNVSAVATDSLRRNNRLSTTLLRKLCGCIGAASGVTGLIVIGWLGCDLVLAVTCLSVFVGLYGISVSGYGPNHLDLAPKFAGTLLGLTNSLGTVPGMLAPVLVGAITNGAETRENWQKVFYLSAGVNAVGAIWFLIFGSGELQPWACGVVQNERRPLINSDEETPESTDKLVA